MAINDAGQIVGQSELPGNSLPGGFPGLPVNHAFLWDATHGIQDLGTLGGGISAATAINAAGQVVGSAGTASFSSHAFVWDAAHGMQDLGTLGGISGSGAVGINTAGQVVGNSFTADNTAPHAFVWDTTRGMQDLGTLGGTMGSGAIAINPAGQVVGVSFLMGNTESHPFIVSTAVSPFAAETALLAGMKAYLPSVTNKDDAKKFAEATGKLKDSLNPSLWSADGMHLVTKTGEQVFNGQKDCVSALQELMKKNPAYSATLQGFINTVLDADRKLASTAITDASGGDRKKIAQANAELAKGDANKAVGKFTDAIDSYRNAWKAAQEARG
jgi:probable HAF family extracellular repeat protein